MPGQRVLPVCRRRLVADRTLDRVDVRLVEDPPDLPRRITRAPRGNRAHQRPVAIVVARRTTPRRFRRCGRPFRDLRDRRRRSHRRLLVRGGRAPAWSPNSSLIAYRGGTQGGSCGGLRLVDADTGRDASPTSAANACHEFGVRQVEAPEWSPDGTEIAVGSTSGVYVINADGTDLRHLNATLLWSGRPAWRPVRGKPVPYGTRAERCAQC